MKKTMFKNNNKRTLHRLLLLVLASAPLFAFAADTSFVPLTGIPGFGEVGNAPSLPVFLNALYKMCIGAAAVIAVVQIMRAGVAIMGNSGSVTANKEAKDLITNSIIGLVLVLSPYVVFSIINPKILQLDLNVSGLQTTATPNPSPTQTAASVVDGSQYGPAKLIPDRDNNPGKVCADNGLYQLNTLSCPTTITAGFACCAAKVKDQYVQAYYFEATRTGSPKCVKSAFRSYSDQKACQADLPNDSIPDSNSTGTYKAGPTTYDHKCDLVSNSTLTSATYKPSSPLPKCEY